MSNPQRVPETKHGDSRYEHDNQIRQAQREVEQSRQRLDEVLTVIETKVQLGTEKVRGAVNVLGAPERLARQHPFGNLGTFLVIGFGIGAILGGKLVKNETTGAQGAWLDGDDLGPSLRTDNASLIERHSVASTMDPESRFIG